MSKFQSRRSFLGLLLLVTLALMSMSSLPMAYAQEGEASVDASGDVQVDEEPVAVEEEDDGAAAAAAAAAAAEEAAEAERAAAEAKVSCCWPTVATSVTRRPFIRISCKSL